MNVFKQVQQRFSSIKTSFYRPRMVAAGPSNQEIRGFTLLELLIVIAIMAILAVVLILVLNPTESLKKSRDTQRISDLSTLKTALGIYATTVANPSLGPDANCLGYAAGADVTTAVIYYSVPQAADPACIANVVEGADVETGSTFGGTGAGGDSCKAVTSANNTLVNGNGWIPVDLTTITGGAPISNLPIDPTNTVGTATVPVNTDLVYRYSCQKVTNTTPLKPQNVFELNATLESAEFGPSGSDDKSAKDGGDHATLYEVGTSVNLMGNSNNY